MKWRDQYAIDERVEIKIYATSGSRQEPSFVPAVVKKNTGTTLLAQATGMSYALEIGRKGDIRKLPLGGAKSCEHLPDGTYRTTRELPALRSDKRIAHDWRYKPVGKGTLFRLHTYLHSGDRTLQPTHTRWAHIDVKPSELPADAFEPVEETPSLWLYRVDDHDWALEILDRLVADGVITLDRIKTTLLRVHADFEKDATDDRFIDQQESPP